MFLGSATQLPEYPRILPTETQKTPLWVHRLPPVPLDAQLSEQRKVSVRINPLGARGRTSPRTRDHIAGVRTSGGGCMERSVTGLLTAGLGAVLLVAPAEGQTKNWG